jgi:MoaA/NifB/PqqE/SkfB family radical SAM enzyme
MPSVAISDIESGDILDPPPLVAPQNGHRHADIDLIDKCNLRCPTCFRGVGAQKNSASSMPLDEFERVVKKFASEGYPNVSLINWTEPFLNKSLDQYIPFVNANGMQCWLSSNLSLPPDRYSGAMVSALAAGVDILFASVSGFSQQTYRINHVSGRMDWVKENLEILARARRHGAFTTSVWVRFLEWPYNSHEKADWVNFCQRIGLGFDAVPAHCDPLNPLPSFEAYRHEVSSRMAPEAKSGTRDIESKICELIADRVAVDAEGDAYLCCAFPNEPRLRIGKYTELSEDELLLRRVEHQYCDLCGITPRDMAGNDRERVRRARASREVGNVYQNINRAAGSRFLDLLKPFSRCFGLWK